VLHPRERFGNFTGDPLGGRRAGHSHPDQPSPSVAKNHQTIEQLERGAADNEHLDRSYSCGVITEERLPPLRPWLAGQS